MHPRRRFVMFVALAAVLFPPVLPSHAVPCCVGPVLAVHQGAAPVPEVTDATTYWTPTGSVVVVGFITNPSSEPMEDVRVTASLIDRSSNDVLPTEAGLVPRMLPPGARAPWRVEISNAPWQQGARARAQAIPVAPDDNIRMPSLEVDPQLTRVDTTGDYRTRLVGLVVNVGSDVASNVRVLGALIAVDGRPIEVGEDRLIVDEIQPGQSAQFAIDFRLGTLPKIVNHVVHAEGTIRP